MPSPKDTFIAACQSFGWQVPEGATLAEVADKLFDHAGRGSDAWASVMVPVRDAAAQAEAGFSAEIVTASLADAWTRALRKGVSAPGAPPPDPEP